MNLHLPWHVQEDLPWAFSNKYGTPVGECFGTSNNNQRAKENAAHVVNCVNQYDKLVEALQKARNVWHNYRITTTDTEDAVLREVNDLLRSCGLSDRERK